MPWVGGSGLWAVCLGSIAHSLSGWPGGLFAATCQGAQSALGGPGSISRVLSVTPSLVPVVCRSQARDASSEGSPHVGRSRRAPSVSPWTKAPSRRSDRRPSPKRDPKILCQSQETTLSCQTLFPQPEQMIIPGTVSVSWHRGRGRAAPHRRAGRLAAAVCFPGKRLRCRPFIACPAAD